MSDDIRKAAEDDPNRCQAMTSRGQCRNLAVEGQTNCACHGGTKQQESKSRNSVRVYRLAKFQTAMKHHTDSPKLKTLNEEVAILRMLLEEQVNRCEDASDLILNSHMISDLVVKIEKLVKSCHTLELKLGHMMDKQALLTLTSQIIDVISEEIQDEDIIEKVSERMMSLIC